MAYVGLKEAGIQARGAVRVLRNGTADGMGPLAIGAPAKRPSPCVEMQENARHSHDAIDDAAENRRAAQRLFESALRPLTPRQETAINLLTMGKTVVATARSIKVDPATVHRWKAHNPLFIAELNRRQAALFDSMVVKLRLAMGKAVEELMSLMTSVNPNKRIDTMWKLLPMIKPQRLMIPTAPTEPADVIDEQIRAERAERGEEAEAEITNEDRLEYVDEDDLAEDEAATNPGATDEYPHPCRQDAPSVERVLPPEGTDESTHPWHPPHRHPEERSNEGPPKPVATDEAPVVEVLRRCAPLDDKAAGDLTCTSSRTPDTSHPPSSSARPDSADSSRPPSAGSSSCDPSPCPSRIRHP